jgi:hypothetical protein
VALGSAAGLAVTLGLGVGEEVAVGGRVSVGLISVVAAAPWTSGRATMCAVGVGVGALVVS